MIGTSSVGGVVGCALLLGLASAGCNSDDFGGGTETLEGGDEVNDDGGDESNTDDGGGCLGVEADVECEDREQEAHSAPHIAGCFGADVDSPPPNNPGALPFLYPGPVDDEALPSQVGVWTEVVDNNGHLPIHSIHRPTGKFLQFGYHETGGVLEDKMVWLPPAPCEDPFGDGIESCEVAFDALPGVPELQNHWEVYDTDPDMSEFNLFCAGHVNLPPDEVLDLLHPRTLTVGGSVPADVNMSFPGTFAFWEEIPDAGIISVGDYDWTELDDLSTYRWYPTATVLADGRIAVPGGVFSNKGTLECRTSEDAIHDHGQDCACEQVMGDPYHDLGVCGDNGFCDPDAEPNDPELGFDPCSQVNDQTNGIDVGVRDDWNNPPLLQTDDDHITWTQEPADVLGPYPEMFVIPDLPHYADNHLGGAYVKVGSETYWGTGNGALAWDPAAPTVALQQIGGPSCAYGSSAVMYASDKILKFGGPRGGNDRVASRLTEVLDLSESCPIWRPAGPTGMPRHYSAGVLLPDGAVISVGGSASRSNFGDADVDEPGDERYYTVFTTELFQPDVELEAPLAGQWCRLADLPGAMPSEVVYRGYHAQAFLLPDGRVYLGAGGRNTATTVEHFDYHIYAPPYLFWGPRPEIDIAAAANGIAWMETGGGTYVIEDAETAPIDRVTLVKLSSSTHQFDQEQRFVELEILEEEEEGEIHVASPPSTCYATPGYYMLFAISTAGVPSIGKYVAITGDCAEADVPIDAPPQPLPAPKMINDLQAAEFPGLRASCGGEGSVLSFADFGQSLLDLCAATGACPSGVSMTATVEVRLASSTGSTNAAPNDLLASDVVVLSDGVPSFVAGGLLVAAAGTEFTSAVTLGPGDHVLEVCADLGVASACTEQPLRIDPVLAGDDDDEYRAGSIEQRALDLRRLIPGDGLPLGDDDVVAVELPRGFSFPFHGDDVDTLYVGANGAIRLGTGAIAASNTGLPQVGAPEIAVYWDDLDPTVSGRVKTYYDGTRFVVAWEDVAVAGGGTISAQAHLHRDGRIELHYPGAADGTSERGAGATIGIQHDGEALVLSVDDDDLLTEADAFAIATGSCVASAMRLPDAMPCNEAVAVAPVDVALCGGSLEHTVALPDVPTVCTRHRDASVTGGIWLGDDPQRSAEDGGVVLHQGDYESRWWVRHTIDPLGSEGDILHLALAEPETAPLRVRHSDAPEVCCKPSQSVAVLTSGNDTQGVGSSGAVCVDAQGGNDFVRSDDYADTLLGGDGSDSLLGNGGADVLHGGLGHDGLAGGDGNDVLLGGDGNDVLEGEGHADELWGGDGDDVLEGGDGADLLVPGPGEDDVNGGLGDDEVVVLDLCEIESGETLDGGGGTDVLWLPVGVTVTDLTTAGVTVSGFESVEEIEGGAFGTAECALL